MEALMTLFVSLIGAAVGLLLLWVVIRSAVENAIIRATIRMKRDGILPTSPKPAPRPARRPESDQSAR